MEETGSQTLIAALGETKNKQDEREVSLINETTYRVLSLSVREYVEEGVPRSPSPVRGDLNHTQGGKINAQGKVHHEKHVPPKGLAPFYMSR